MTNRQIILVAVVCFIVFAFLNLASINENSPVFDEVSHHIGIGYSFIKTRDFRLNSTQPPLVEELAAISMLVLNPIFPIEHPSWKNVDRTTFGYHFLYESNLNANQLVFFARLPVIFLSIILGLLIFLWVKEQYGRRAAIFSLFLYLFSPNIIAYSHIVTADICVTVFIYLSLYRFYKFILKPKLKNIIFTGIVLGLAQGSKVTALILLPLFLLFVIYQLFCTKKLRYLYGFMLMLLICFSVVFLVYLGEIKPLLVNDVDVQEKLNYIKMFTNKFFNGNPAIEQKITNFALHQPIPFATYIMNILSSSNMIFRERIFKVHFLGSYTNEVYWYFYPIVFLLKTPIPTLIFLMFALFGFKKIKPKNYLSEVILIGFLVTFTFVSLTSRLQGGVRYILPLYPGLFILISKIAEIKIKRLFFLNIVLILLCLLSFAETLKIHPHYMSYFNQLCGGPDNGWKYLRETNTDYGQDLPALANYIKKNNISNFKFLYCGTAEPKYYGLKYEGFEKSDFETPGNCIYAISVNYLESVRWAIDLKPTAKAGYTIFIYDLRKEK